MGQLALFKGMPVTFKKKDISQGYREQIHKVELVREKEQHKEESYLESLKTAHYLWDMRAWKEYKNPAEVAEYVVNPTHKNEGHAQWCIERLKELGIPAKRIIDAVMSNNNIAYKNRIGPCMLDFTCAKAEKNGGYSGGICNDCK